MAAAYFEQGVTDGTQTAEQFLDYLNKRYGDPNATARALDRLRELRQKPSETFASFLPKFEKELADSGGASWNDAVQINYLNGALNDKLADRLISVPSLPKDFNGFTELLLTISSRLDSQWSQARQTERYREDRRPKEKRVSWPEPTTDAMDWEKTKLSSTNSSRRAKWATEEELDKRRRRRACLRCGYEGHFIGQCSLRAAVPPTQVSRTHTRASREDSDEDSEEPGKE